MKIYDFYWFTGLERVKAKMLRREGSNLRPPAGGYEPTSYFLIRERINNLPAAVFLKCKS